MRSLKPCKGAIPSLGQFCEYSSWYSFFALLSRNVVASGAVARVATRVGVKAASKGGRKVAKHAVEHHNNNNNNKRRKRSDDEYEFEREFDELDVRGFYDDLD